MDYITTELYKTLDISAHLPGVGLPRFKEIAAAIGLRRAMPGRRAA